MTLEQVIHEWILARAQLAHLRSTERRVPWEALSADEREPFMSCARTYVEPRLRRGAKQLERASA